MKKGNEFIAISLIYWRYIKSKWQSIIPIAALMFITFNAIYFMDRNIIDIFWRKIIVIVPLALIFMYLLLKYALDMEKDCSKEVIEVVLKNLEEELKKMGITKSGLLKLSESARRKIMDRDTEELMRNNLKRERK